MLKLRILAVVITSAALLGGAAATTPAQEVKEFEGTIAAPLPVLSNEMSGHWVTGGDLRQVCPEPGPADEIFYKFFDLEGDFKHFFVSGPDLLLNEPDPTGVWGAFQDYDLDLYLYDAKCNELDVEGSIMTGAGYGNGSVAGKTPARYAVISYFAGPPNLPVLLEASNAKITKK